MESKRASLKKKKFNKDNIWGAALASPPLIGFLLFGVIPMLFSVVISFTDFRGFMLEDMQFLGFAHMFDNYGKILSDSLFWQSLGNTLYAALSLPLSMAIALLLAVLMNRKIKCKTLFRVLFFVPYVCSIVALTSIWRTLLDQNYGFVNEFLGVFGIPAVNWLNDPRYFMPAMILMGTWQSIGFNLILFSAALTNVNPAYYEAAKLDGANAWQRFWKITFPIISPTTFYLLIVGLIGSLQEFTRFQAIGFGETPSNAGMTVVFYLYNKAFKDNWTYGMGYAAACSWIVAAIILVLTVVNFRVSKKWVNYE